MKLPILALLVISGCLASTQGQTPMPPVAATPSAASSPCCPPGTVCPVPVVAQARPLAAIPTALPAESGKPAVSGVTPLQAALAKLVADSVAWESTNGSLAAAQAVVTNLTPIATTQAQAIVADQAEIAKLVNVPTPQPQPPAPPGPAVTLLVIGSTTCAPCVEMHADIDALKASGIPISRIDTDKDPTAAKWAVTATPTSLVLVDGVEVNRYVGKLSKAALKDWYDKSLEWARNKPKEK